MNRMPFSRDASVSFARTEIHRTCSIGEQSRQSTGVESSHAIVKKNLLATIGEVLVTLWKRLQLRFNRIERLSNVHGGGRTLGDEEEITREQTCDHYRQCH